MQPRAVMALEEWRRKAAAGEAPADVVLRKHYVPEEVKAEAGSRRISFVISTEAVDREGDTIAVAGWDLANFLKNPVVLFAHRYSDLPVAKAISVTKTAGQLKAVAEFPEPGLYALADTVYEMLKGGFLRATSVGFRPKKSAHNEERPGWAMDFLEQELLEFSVVPVPANPDALMEQAKGFAGALRAGVDLAPLEHALAVAKSGRTFSRANAKLIRDAHEACDAAREACMRSVGHLKDLLAQIPEEPPDDDGAEEEAADDSELVEEAARSAAAPTAPAPAPAPAPAAPAGPPIYVVTAKDLCASAEAAVTAALAAGTRAALS